MYYMNWNNLYTIVLLCSLLLVSCTNEEYAEKREQVEEGLPATVSLSLNAVQMDKIQTRSGEALANDGKVFDLMIFLIKGDAAECVYFENGLGNESASTNITFSVESTNDVQLYALANVEGGSYRLDKEDGSFSVEELKAINSKSALMDITATLNGELISYMDGYVLMSGYLASSGTDNDASVISITPGKNVITDKKIYLRRVSSAVTFSIKAGENVTFTPKTWQIKNVPYTTNLFEKENDATGQYFDMEQAEPVPNSKKFTFYMSENRKYSNKQKPEYDDRPGFAPTGSSYLVLTGEYDGPARYNSSGEAASAKVHANVTYYIYLGYIDKDVNNFETKRNKKYEYNITVTNVDKIIQEVVAIDYNYQTGDGDVYYTDGSGQQIESLDSHNCSFDIVVDRNDLKEGIEYGFSVKTPKTDYIWQDDKIQEDGNYADIDIDWVRFVKIDHLGENVFYPGDEKTKTLTVRKFVSDIDNAVNKKSAENSDFFDKDGKAYFRVFVLEYYYGDDDWKEGINGQNREMKIIMNTQTGHGSSVTDAKYYFSQKPIQSIYDVDKVNAAWGIEWVNESKRLPYYTTITDNDICNFNKPSQAGPRDQYDGRANMIQELGTMVGQKGGWENDDISKYAYAACMSRNRDENGDGDINENEIKWYLPASNQYNDIWMGTEGIDQEAWLYPYSKIKYEKVHFASNTWDRNIFWSEEGASISGFGNKNRVPDGMVEIRCARNLGKTYGKITSGPESEIPDLINSKENKNYRLIEVINLNKKSFRNKQVRNELGKHFEDEENNKLYKAFLVQKKAVDANRFLVEVNKKADNNESPCDTKNGWRLPNQREYTMFADRYDISGTYITRTLYSFGLLSNGPGSKSYNANGYMYNGGHMGLSGPNGTDYPANIRCVRDIDQSEYSRFGF